MIQKRPTPAMKYVIIGDGGYEFPILFPIEWGHDEVAGKLAHKGQAIVAAGFAQTDGDGRVQCCGRSASLGVDARPERDAAVISRWLAGA